MSDRQPVEALLVDPNPEDVRLFLDALENEKIANRIHTVSNRREALDFLHRRGEYEDAPRPNLILLEYELPRLSGPDVLEELDDHDELAGVPVIVLTDSDEAESVAKSYDLNANAYIQKPVDPDEFIDLARSLEHFWLEIVWLPPDDEDGGEQ